MDSLRKPWMRFVVRTGLELCYEWHGRLFPLSDSPRLTPLVTARMSSMEAVENQGGFTTAPTGLGNPSRISTLPRLSDRSSIKRNETGRSVTN
jgi:hypothetical protein